MARYIVWPALAALVLVGCNTDPVTGDTAIPGWLELVLAAAGAGATFMFSFLGRWFGKLMDLAAQRSKLAFLQNVDEVVIGVVQDLYVREVEALKAAAKDGKLTTDEKEKMKAIAVDWAKGLLDAKHLKALFGGNIDAALGGRVDLAVQKLKNSAKAAENPTDPQL